VAQVIKIYGTQNCSYCKQAKDVAESYDLPYEYIDLHEGDNMNIFQKKFPGVRTVPQIVWYEKHVGGFTEFLQEIEDTRTYGDGSV